MLTNHDSIAPFRRVQTLMRWFGWIFASPVVTGLLSGVLLLAVSPRESSMDVLRREASSDSRAAISTPFLRAVASLRVEVGAQAQRRVRPHADGAAAPVTHAISIVALSHPVRVPQSAAHSVATIVGYGYDATAPPS